MSFTKKKVKYFREKTKESGGNRHREYVYLWEKEGFFSPEKANVII